MLRLLLTAALATIVSCEGSSAQTYPDRPVKFVVGFGPGGPDTGARTLASYLGAQTGKSFIVENRPGATGKIANEVVAAAKPDGYTLLFTTDSFSTLPSLYKTLDFDPIKDFRPVGAISATSASFLVVSSSMPLKSLADLVAYAKDPKNKVNYGSTGVGSGAHLRAAMFNKNIGASIAHAPYKSPGEALTALLGGDIQMLFVTSSSGLPMINSGKIRALAYDSTVRHSAAPDVPTMSEAGVPASGVPNGWHGVLAPANTPEPIVKWLEEKIQQASNDSRYREQLDAQGSLPLGASSVEFAEMIKTNIARNLEATRAAGIEPQ